MGSAEGHEEQDRGWHLEDSKVWGTQQCLGFVICEMGPASEGA